MVYLVDKRAAVSTYLARLHVPDNHRKIAGRVRTSTVL